MWAGHWEPLLLRAYIVSAVLLFVLWLLLTGSLDPQEIVVGSIAALHNDPGRWGVVGRKA